MRQSLCSVFLFAACILVAASGPGLAADEGAAGSPTRLNIISTNPILDMFGWLNIEYEHVIMKSSTIGAAGSYLTLDDGDESYTSGNVFYRYYPAGIAPEGFFFGGRVGMTSVSKDREGGSADASAFGIGIDIGYTWLIGRPKRMALSLGIGAVRYFGGDLKDIDVSTTLPTIRLVNIGIAF